MNSAGLYSFLADTILVIHFAFVVFVVFGFMLILIGLLARWSWIHNRVFRIAHLVAIGFVVLQAWFGQLCPLTLWENDLRRAAGQSGYTETFIEHWLHEVLFYQATPSWVFTTIYTCFGALVILVWFFGRRSGKGVVAPMNDTSTLAGPVSIYRSEVSQLHGGGVLHFRLFGGGEPLSWSGVLDRWQNDKLFRNFFISILVDAPYSAYFWETPPVTSATADLEFEFVLVDSPQLAGASTDQQAFKRHFAAAKPGASVIEFSNLGGDATLVVPCPRGPLSAYSQICTFAHQAPDEQQHQLWQLVGATLERQLGAQPVWVSTSGLGIYWLHIRFDSTPKYYTYAPYRNRLQ